MPNAKEQYPADHRHSERRDDETTSTPRGGFITTDLAQKPRLTPISLRCSIRDASYVGCECGSHQRVEQQEDNETYCGVHRVRLVCLRHSLIEHAYSTSVGCHQTYRGLIHPVRLPHHAAPRRRAPGRRRLGLAGLCGAGLSGCASLIFAAACHYGFLRGRLNDLGGGRRVVNFGSVIGSMMVSWGGRGRNSSTMARFRFALVRTL